MARENKEKQNSILIKEQIANSIGLPIIILDKKFKKLQLNQKASQVFKNVANIESFIALLGPAAAKRLQSTAEKAIGSGKEKPLNLKIKNREWNLKMYPGKAGVTIIFDKPLKIPQQTRNLPNKTILDAMGDSFILTDSDLKIVDVNNAICKSLGRSRAQLIGKDASQFDYLLSKEDLKKLHKKAEKGHVIFDTKFINKKGVLSDAEVNLFLLKKGGKKYYGSIGRDITEYKKIQSELESSNDRLTHITNAANDALWELNMVTGERWANEIHQRLYGLKKSDPMPDSKTWEQHIHPKQRRKIVESLALFMKKKQSFWNVEYWFKIGKNNWIYIYDRTLLYYDKNGALVKMMGSMVDVTELKTAQDELKAHRNLSESIINALPGIFYLIDKEGNFLKWNKNFETITGYTTEEISGMKPFDFFYRKESGKLTEKIQEVFQKGWSEMEGTLVNKSGHGKPYYLSGWRTIVGDQECLIGTGIDISEIKKAQESIRRMELKIADQKIQDQKVISRTIIAAQEKERNHIGKELHDNVNQLLAGTRLYLTMGAKKHPEFKEAIKYPLELLDKGIQEIRALTHHHISPAKDMDLKQLAEGIVELLKTASINCHLDYSLNAELPENLLINVYRIMQEEANNILKHSGASNVTFNIHSGNSSLYISTIDDGKGFDINQQREGIGISNIFNRVESYNGIIEITSSPGKGCQIEIQIPIPDYIQLNSGGKAIETTSYSFE